MHIHMTIFKLMTPLKHICMIYSFITICSFYLIINLNQGCPLPNEISNDAAYFALDKRLNGHFSRNLLSCQQFSMYWTRTGLAVEGRNHKKFPGFKSLSTLTLWTCLIYGEYLINEEASFEVGDFKIGESITNNVRFCIIQLLKLKLKNYKRWWTDYLTLKGIIAWKSNIDMLQLIRATRIN